MGRRNQNRPPKQKAKAVMAPGFPRYETTNFEDPEDFAVWAFAGLPHVKGAPLAIPVPMLRWISKRLWDCGFRHHPELRTVKYREPHTGMGLGMLTAAGDWVPLDEPDDVPEGSDEGRVAQARAVMAGLPAAERVKVAHALGLDVPTPDNDDGGGLVPYRQRDGSTIMVTPARARAWRNARRAAGRGPGTTAEVES